MNHSEKLKSFVDLVEGQVDDRIEVSLFLYLWLCKGGPSSTAEGLKLLDEAGYQAFWSKPNDQGERALSIKVRQLKFKVAIDFSAAYYEDVQKYLASADYQTSSKGCA